MSAVNLLMASKEDLIDNISKILNAAGDLDFLGKLAPRELAVLTARLKESLDRKE